MGSAANKLVPVSGVVKYISSLDNIEAIMWLRKPGDTKRGIKEIMSFKFTQKQRRSTQSRGPSSEGEICRRE